jgi:hypothetical protein
VGRSERRRRHAQDTGEVHGCSHTCVSAVVLGCVTTRSRAALCSCVCVMMFSGSNYRLIRETNWRLWTARTC